MSASHLLELQGSQQTLATCAPLATLCHVVYITSLIWKLEIGLLPGARASGIIYICRVNDPVDLLLLFPIGSSAEFVVLPFSSLLLQNMNYHGL